MQHDRAYERDVSRHGCDLGEDPETKDVGAYLKVFGVGLGMEDDADRVPHFECVCAGCEITLC